MGWRWAATRGASLDQSLNERLSLVASAAGSRRVSLAPLAPRFHCRAGFCGARVAPGRHGSPLLALFQVAPPLPSGAWHASCASGRRRPAASPRALGDRSCCVVPLHPRLVLSSLSALAPCSLPPLPPSSSSGVMPSRPNSSASPSVARFHSEGASSPTSMLPPVVSSSRSTAPLISPALRPMRAGITLSQRSAIGSCALTRSWSCVTFLAPSLSSARLSRVLACRGTSNSR